MRLRSIKNLIKGCDLFPKVIDTFQISSSTGGFTFIFAFVVILVLCVSELQYYNETRRFTTYHVDHTPLTSPSNYLRINFDISVLSKCRDISADVIDLSDIPIKANIQTKDVILNSKNEPLNKGKINACRFRGTVKVNKVAGNFHFSGGIGTTTHAGIHTHISLPKTGLNFTHKIHSLSFGEKYPGQLNPLDNEVVILDEGYKAMQYFISIVPTIYEFDGKKLYTNQYSFTAQKSDSFPGIFFKYDTHPIVMNVVDENISLSHVLTRIVGIIGGVFGTSGLFHNLSEYLVFRKPSKFVNTPRSSQ